MYEEIREHLQAFHDTVYVDSTQVIQLGGPWVTLGTCNNIREEIRGYLKLFDYTVYGDSKTISQ
jgi:hypothetical protein